MYILLKWDILISSSFFSLCTILPLYNFTVSCTGPWGNQDLKWWSEAPVWGAILCAMSQSQCEAGGMLPSGLEWKAMSVFLLASPGMQILISHCPMMWLVCRLLAWAGKSWFQTGNVALVFCFAWGISSHCYRTEFRLLVSRSITQ